MRTKLFLSFILIIFLALLSNVVFERLIINDFQEFARSTDEDLIYWVLASVEGSYRENNWDTQLLSEALHWGIMLGFDTYVEDPSGERVLSSSDVLPHLNPNMLKRMNSLFELPSGAGEFSWYPLFVEGNEVGRLYIMPLKRLGNLPLKEDIFLRRGREFLVISFLIAGGGAVLLSILFTLFLSTPIRRLTKAAEKIAEGDFSVKIPGRNRTGRIPAFLRGSDEINRLTESFNYMIDALRKEDALRKHLTSNIAHELRTPLTIIKGNLEAIEDGVISDPRAVIKDISSEIERIISLVEGIEDVTRAEASFFKRGKPEPVELSGFIGSIMSGMRGILDEKGLYVELNGPAINVRTYPDKLHIILKNLITNSYKYTEKGGITITWDTCSVDGSRGFYVSVRDTGRGIEEADTQKVFDRFYKGKDSDGMGLGLAIVKELTETMDGKIEIRSTPESGTEFIIRFRTDT